MLGVFRCPILPGSGPPEPPLLFSLLGTFNYRRDSFFALGQPRVLFSGVGYGGGADFPQPIGQERKVSLDDQRFVMLRRVDVEDVEAENELIVVENFFEELKERVGN